MTDEREFTPTEIAELRRENEQLKAEVTRLTEAFAEALKRVEELEQKQVPAFVKPNRRK